jgi:hypothetical protein
MLMELTAFMKIFIDDIKKGLVKSSSRSVGADLCLQVPKYIGVPTENRMDGHLFQEPSQRRSE